MEKLETLDEGAVEAASPVATGKPAIAARTASTRKASVAKASGQKTAEPKGSAARTTLAKQARVPAASADPLDQPGEALDKWLPGTTRARPGDLAAAQRQVAALVAKGDPVALESALSAMVDRFSEEPGFLAFASDTFWTMSSGDGSRDAELARKAWATTLCAVIPGADNDDQGVDLIRRLAEQYAVGNAFDPAIGYYEEYETALEAFGRAGPRSALAAANLLTATNPAKSLEVVASADDSLGEVLVRASAHCELGEHEEAARQFDYLERLWGHGPLDLHLDDRFQWVQSMAETGRFGEAERVCTTTRELIRVRREEARAGGKPLDPEGLDDDPTGHWAHVYEIMAGRLAHLQGRFAEGWEHFRAASDDDTESPDLRRSALRLRLMLADHARAAATLRELEALAAEQDTDEAYATFVDAALWASAQWGNEATSVVRSLDEPEDPDEKYLADARLKGQVAARALLARGGKQLDLGQRLRLALLAGDDRTAARLLDKNPLGKDDPWPLRVLAAVLALRCGRDAEAAETLGKVLSSRRHDVDLRILHAQAALLGDEHQTALAEAIACTESMPLHLVARVVKAECEFETTLANRSAEGGDESAENAQLLIQAVADYRLAADLHCSTRHYLVSGTPRGPIGSEPLAPRMYEEVCRRGLHAAILAQEELDRLSLRGDRRLRADATALLDQLRQVTRPCCRRPRGALAAAWHRAGHAFDQDEAARLEDLLNAHRSFQWRQRAQNLALVVVGALVGALGLTGTLPGPPSDAIRTTVVALGIILLMMPFARSLKIGAVEFTRPEVARPVFGRSRALRTSSLMQRGYHLGSFALPPTPERGRSRREIVEADLAG